MLTFELRTRVYRGCLVVALCGELDTMDAERAAAEVAALTADGQRLIVDLDALRFIDCHSLRALLGARETARRAGGDLLLAAPRGAVLRLLTVAGVAGVLPSVPAAAESARRGDVRSAAGLPVVGVPGPGEQCCEVSGTG